MTLSTQTATKPAVRLIGDVSHADFRDAVALLRDDAHLLATADMPPELVVVAQSRPGAVDASIASDVRRSSPLAGFVALVGSWCEGEMRTGKPWPGVERLYWYQFPSWWKRQLALRAAGRCPDWARREEPRLRIATRQNAGLIAINAGYRDTANAIADVLQRAGYSTVCQSAGRPGATLRGAVAGIWDGGHLNEREAEQLSKVCRRLAIEGTPVAALLDFPRRDSIDRALRLGAACVLGKPWANHDLIELLQVTIHTSRLMHAA